MARTRIRPYPDEPRILFEAALKLDLKPEWILPDQLFAIQTKEGEAYVHDTYSPLNSRLATSLTQDKYLTHVLLDRHGLPNIPYLNTSDQKEAQNFLSQHNKIVAKPYAGSDSQDIHIIKNPAQLTHLYIEEYLLEKFIPGLEVRYLVVQGKVLAVHEMHWDNKAPHPNRSVRRVSLPPAQWNNDLVAMASRVASIFELGYTAVDYIVQARGEVLILEVNSLPSMYPFHYPKFGPAINIAQIVLACAYK